MCLTFVAFVLRLINLFLCWICVLGVRICVYLFGQLLLVIYFALGFDLWLIML